MKKRKLQKKILCGVLAGAFVLGLAGSVSAADEKIRVGSKDFTENEIVAELYALALEDAGFEVERIMEDRKSTRLNSSHSV